MTALALLVFTARFYWRSEPPRFAVLPFATGADPSLHQVRSELLNELIHQIGSRPPGRLLVTGRDSSMQFAAREPSARQVRDVLRADYVLLGKLRRDGSRLEAVARLIDARRNVQIRSWTVHADLAQTSFDRDIASQLSGKVFELLYPDASHRADLSDQCRGCWEPLRNARTLQAKGTEEGYQRSASLFEEASRIEQRCDRAWSGMAESLVALARRNGDEALLERARRAAQEALRRNPLNAEAMQALANVHLWRDWDWREAERLLRRSLEASPSAATAHQDMAWFLVTSGRRAEAVASVRRAIALDP
ncbi:MAG TPA: hypothetical protein DEH78_28440, partial [Solibacterales bacterium]|nr:hypothetical protein [Bryobacterales bacterium]